MSNVQVVAGYVVGAMTKENYLPHRNEKEGINYGQDKDGAFTSLKEHAVKYTTMFLANWAVDEVFGFRKDVYSNFWKQVYRGSYAMYNRNFDHLNYH